MLDGLVDRGGDVDEPRLVQRVGHLEAGEVDDLLDQLAQPGGLDLHPAGEALDGLRVVAGVEHGLGEEGQAAHRCLELVADVGDEVTTDLLHRRAWVVSSRRSRTWLLPSSATRVHEHPSSTHPAAGELELRLADHAVTADLPGEVAQLGVNQLAAPDQAVGRRGARC